MGSRYQTLLVREDNAFLSPFGPPTVATRMDAAATPLPSPHRGTTSPMHPVKLPIPPRFNPLQPPPAWTIDTPIRYRGEGGKPVGFTYGPVATGFASLRYYGDGPY